jgi:DHA1 family bicyclomycin/chloramphenicol resistance-like MFS transporter
LFEGAAGRAKLSHLASLMLFVPMVAPAAGTVILTVGSWRSLYALLAGIGLVLLGIVSLFLGESARTDNAERFSPAMMVRGYARALTNPVCLGYILVNAAGFGALFAYISGSSLLFIDALGLSSGQYSLVYAATFIGIMASVLLNGQLSTRGIAPAYPLGTGIALALCSAAAFLMAILAGWTWALGLAGILILGAMGFGLIVPNAIHAAMQPLPTQAGAVSAMMAFVQVLVQSASSAIVVSFNDRDPGLSMAGSLVFWSLMALLAYIGLARPAEEGAVTEPLAALAGRLPILEDSGSPSGLRAQCALDHAADSRRSGSALSPAQSSGQNSSVGVRR